MKLTPEQQLERKARENIKRLINRVSSEFSFKKWRTYHGYLHSMGRDIEGADRELSRADLDELLQKYEEQAYASLQPRKDSNGSSAVTLGQQPNKSSERDGSVNTTEDTSVVRRTGTDNIPVSNPVQQEEKFTEKNNYGLQKSEKEMITLFWFQKKCAAEVLQGFDL